jgi:hypothetical protein
MYLVETLVILADLKNSEEPDEYAKMRVHNDQEVNSIINMIDENLSSIFLDIAHVFTVQNKLFFDSNVQKNITLLLSLLITFVVFLIFGYLFYVFPKAEEMKNRVLMTIRLLSMIPPSIISGTASIRNYLNGISL